MTKTAGLFRRTYLRHVRIAPFLAGPIGFCIAVAIALAIAFGVGTYDFHFTTTLPGAVTEADSREQDVGMVTTEWSGRTIDARLEQIAPWLLLVPLTVYWLRTIVTRNPLYMVLLVLTAILLCREIHFTGMDRAVYVLGAVWLVWILVWRDELNPRLDADGRHTAWIIATIAMYAFAQFIDRRPFKRIPGEPLVHTELEEIAETLAHVMLIITSLVGTWRRRAAVPPTAAEGCDACR